MNKRDRKSFSAGVGDNNNAKRQQQGDSKRAARASSQQRQEREFPEQEELVSQENETRAQRYRALQALREADDLISMETALYLVEEVRLTEDCDDESVKELVEQAKLALPYLLSKTLIQLMTTADAEGPAFSLRQAKSITAALIKNMRIDTRMFGISEDALVKRCDIRTQDAQRLCPHLIRFKNENQNKAECIQQFVTEGIRWDDTIHSKLEREDDYMHLPVTGNNGD